MLGAVPIGRVDGIMKIDYGASSDTEHLEVLNLRDGDSLPGYRDQAQG